MSIKSQSHSQDISSSPTMSGGISCQICQVHRFPHIVYFTSLTEMIQLVQSLDLNAVSLRMQALFFAAPSDTDWKRLQKGMATRPRIKKKNVKLFTNFAFFHLFSCQLITAHFLYSNAIAVVALIFLMCDFLATWCY